MARIEVVNETEQYVIYLSYYGNVPVRLIKNKQTGEILINADDACTAIGIDKSFDEYLGSDEGLDAISEIKKNHPEKKLFGNDGMFRKVMI